MLLPRPSFFWFTLGYGIFVGYEVRKHGIDKKIARAIGKAADELSRHQANLMLDEIEKRRITKMAVTDGPEG